MAIHRIKTHLIEQRDIKLSGSIYHVTQIKFAYHSNHIDGNRLTEEQTRLIYETRSILPNDTGNAIMVDDIIESNNHFRLFDFIIDHADTPLSKELILEMHRILKSGTYDSMKTWFAVGAWKTLPNSIGDFTETTDPSEVDGEITQLLGEYHQKTTKSLNDIVDFHVRFERILPFQNGNGLVGRAILFKECLANNIVPFIIEDQQKPNYYQGLNNEPGFLIETCLTAQDRYKAYCRYFLEMNFD